MAPMSADQVHVGDHWRVRIDVLEGERQIVATFGQTVAVCAPPDFHIDYFRWHQIEFLELLSRRTVLT